MGMLVALIPALFFGFTGIVATLMGGKPAQNTLGTTFGAFIFGILTTLLFVVPQAGWSFAMNPRIWLVGFLSGIFWALGQHGQYAAIERTGISVANPLSTSGQVVGNALMAAIVLGEWKSASSWIFGIIAIILVVAGALCTSVQDKNNEQSVPRARFNQGLMWILISTLGFMIYFVLPNLLHQWHFITDSVYNAPNGNGLYYMTAIVLPQSISQMLGALLIVIFLEKDASLIVEKHTFKNIFAGLVWAVGNVFVFISCANPNVGQAIATTFSQLGVIVATFGGIVILHEHKTKRQMGYIVLGTILIVVGALLMGTMTAK